MRSLLKLFSFLSLFAAISGIILSIMDILNMTLSHFLKMRRLELIQTSKPYVDIYDCEPSNSSEKNSPSTQYCNSIQSVFLGILSAMLISAFFQKLVTAGIVENEWKRMCTRSKSNVVLLSAGEKNEQTIKMKEEIIELSGVSSQPKNEEEIEIIPVQEEEEEEAEINFPAPPQEQESLPVENEIAPYFHSLTLHREATSSSPSHLKNAVIIKDCLLPCLGSLTLAETLKNPILIHLFLGCVSQ